MATVSTCFAQFRQLVGSILSSHMFFGKSSHPQKMIIYHSIRSSILTAGTVQGCHGHYTHGKIMEHIFKNMYNVVKTIVNHPFGNCLYNLFMVICGMVYYWFNFGFTTLSSILESLQSSSITMWGPQDVSWYRFAPVTIATNTINQSYWSYVRQLGYRTGPHIVRKHTPRKIETPSWELMWKHNLETAGSSIEGAPWPPKRGRTCRVVLATVMAFNS